MDTRRVLLVGAGGIGCEVLKNLVFAGYRSVDVVDMDTIELSNLNRQFLFRRHHIGQSKASVAVAAVSAWLPGTEASSTDADMQSTTDHVPSPRRKRRAPSSGDEDGSAHSPAKRARSSPTACIGLRAHCANIKDAARFPPAFFAQFDAVCNALDNADARRYVNAMCLAVGVPLVESGTAGYLGQCGVVLPPGTNGPAAECFDCTEKPRPVTFPVCTIRSTPTAPVHCVVWAKEHLFPALFGPGDASEITDDVEESVAETLRQEDADFSRLRALLSSAGSETTANGALDAPSAVVHKAFVEDVAKLLESTAESDMWATRAAPVPLDAALVTATDDATVCATIDIHSEYTPAQAAAALRSAIRVLASRTQPLFFEKDDDAAMDFVAAASALRARVYGIAGVGGRFALKAIAGNIIPAIATTNAIVAGLVVLQLNSLLAGRTERVRTAFLTYGADRGSLMACEPLAPPNPLCAVCGVDRARVTLPVATTSVAALLARVLPLYAEAAGADLEAEEATIALGTRVIYDPDMDASLAERSLQTVCGASSAVLVVDVPPRDRPLVVCLLDGPDLSASFSIAPSRPSPPSSKANGDDLISEDEIEVI